MARVVWFRDDIIMIVSGLHGAARHNRDKRFRIGYEAALDDIARAFGLLFKRVPLVERGEDVREIPETPVMK